MSEKTAIEFVKINKAFGNLQANDQISFSVKRGSIHALVGENGAGKSTLMKILFGMVQKDSGAIKLDNKEIHFKSPIDAKKNKIGMVHQHFMLAKNMKAIDHIILDNDIDSQYSIKNLFSPISRKKLLMKLDMICEKLKMPVEWNKMIADLPVGIQQRIEILKLIFAENSILILDEPTAVLTPQEIEQLFQQLLKLKDEGKTIIIITHKLKEVLRLADYVTVLRQGKSISTSLVKNENIQSLSEKLVGHHLSTVSIPHELNLMQNRIIVRNLQLEKNNRKLLNDISFEIKSSEILGIAGVEGNGQSEMIQAFICPENLEGKKSGQIQAQNKNLLHMKSSEIRRLGIHYFPEDRLEQGILPSSNALENFLLGHQYDHDFQKNGIIQNNNLKKAVTQVFEKYNVQPQDMDLSLSQFSGGNQQKFVVGRELYKNPFFLVAAQPTRGVDIGAIQNIHQSLIEQKKMGTSILLISSELDELFELSDRILVIFNGQIIDQFNRAEFDEKIIGQRMAGIKE